MTEETHPRRERREVLVRGVVQGVGFRPFVYRLALEEGLAGFIGNDTDGVTIEIEGTAERVEAFLARLTAEAPPLARIDSVIVRELAASGEALAGQAEFRIVTSEVVGQVSTGIPADAATCADCLRELLDPDGSPVSLSVFELHQLRAALHDYAKDSLRPAADLDGAVYDVRGLPGGVRRSGESAISCAAECLLGLRSAGVAGGGGWRRRLLADDAVACDD